MTEKETRSKRQIIIDAIEAGGATIESLAAEAECKYASVMSNFSMLRLMGKFPVKDVAIEADDGTEVLTYRFVDAAEMEQIKADQAANATGPRASAKSPAERLDAAEKRFARCDKAAEAATARSDKDPDSEILTLRSSKAGIDLRLAEIELDEAKANCPVEEDGVIEDGLDEVESEETVVE